MAPSSGDAPERSVCGLHRSLFDAGWNHTGMKVVTVLTPKYWHLSSSRGVSTGMEREAPRLLKAQVSKAAQKPGPISAHRTKKSGNSTRETAVLAHLRCANSDENNCWRHSGISELVLSCISSCCHPPVFQGAMPCSAPAPTAPRPALQPSTPNVSPISVRYHECATAVSFFRPSPVLFRYQGRSANRLLCHYISGCCLQHFEPKQFIWAQQH